jgi:asparagine synthase (glutamine-hydrolysing)
MIAALKHRGPDDTGLFADTGIGLANARLSIIDIEGGHQPIHNEDETIQVTYNGELYNYRKLREELENLGHKFYTKSDTEVIVHSYEQYGENFVSHLNGMFAIAIWDAPRRKLILARDRMGIKPLYYTLQKGNLLFASEIKGILQAKIPRDVDRTALYAILNLGYVSGERTLLEGVFKLPPSSILVYQEGSIKVTQYWNIPPIQITTNEDSVVANLQRVLEESVRDQLVADVPVGCFLSGGLDTSTIVAFASKAVSQPLKTFCMGFGEDTDEFRDARLIAEHFGTDHHEIMVDSSQAIKLYPRMIWHMEAPKYNLYPWFVCELVHKHVKVCLSGNGGDEVFGGYYARYSNALRIDQLSRKTFSPMLRLSGEALQPLTSDIKIENRLRVLGALGDNTSEYLILAGALPKSVNKELLKHDRPPKADLEKHYSQYFRGTDLVQGLMNCELRTKLVDDLLSVDDTMSMAHSLELRVPLLDNRIVDLMATIPWAMKYSPGTHGKLLLRKAIKGILPEDSLKKPKWGFSVDVDAWYKGELGELVRQIVPESNVIGKYFNQRFVRSLVTRRLSSRHRRYQVLLWQLLGFHFWHRVFIDSDEPGAGNLELNALVA